MKEITALVSLLSKQKIKQINILTENSNQSKKSKELYEGLKNGIVTNDDTAIKLLGYETTKSPAYIKLKQRFKQRLINTLFFIDINQYSRTSFEKALHKCYHNWAASKILIDRLHRSTATAIEENILKTALKYDLTELIFLISKDLRLYFGTYQINLKKIEYYDQLVAENFKLLEHELQAEKLFSDLAREIVGAKSANPQLLKETYLKKVNELKEILTHNKRYYFNAYAYNAIYYYYLLQKDYKAILNISTNALNFFKSKDGYSPAAKFSFSTKLGLAHLHFNQYQKAEGLFLESLKMGPTAGSINWYVAHNYLFIIYSIQKKYQDAFNILVNALTHPNFNKLPESTSEPWRVKEAYMHFLLREGKVKASEVEGKKLRPFRIGRFLNEVPLYSKFKRGVNISILIVQMLFLIQDRKFSKVIDRIDALKQYSYRYLRNDDTFRSNCFIKMLLKLPEADYHPIRVARYTEKLKTRLELTPMNVSEQFYEIEIIPYEHLWDLVIDLLDKQRNS